MCHNNIQFGQFSIFTQYLLNYLFFLCVLLLLVMLLRLCMLLWRQLKLIFALKMQFSRHFLSFSVVLRERVGCCHLLELLLPHVHASHFRSPTPQIAARIPPRLPPGNSHSFSLHFPFSSRGKCNVA